MSFLVRPLPAASFEHLFGRDAEALSASGVIVRTVDARPGFPCRVSLRDGDIGGRALLMNFEHQPANSPFRSSHAIYVMDGAREAQPDLNEVPQVMASRLLSIRAFSAEGMIVAGDVVDGAGAGPAFNDMLAREDVAYLHAHYARLGCFAARVERA